MIISRIASLNQQPSGNVNASFKSTNSVDIIPFKEICGKASNVRYSQGDLNNSIIEKDIPFKIKNEDWNAYKLSTGKELRIKQALVQVSQTDKFDEKGEPIFVINTQSLFKIL
ncbi:MAG: hypothetical protein FJ360_01595 [Thaumarchaeota archaeon]|nr:hypothetical protein [Nitrososphaerota archaeon]